MPAPLTKATTYRSTLLFQRLTRKSLTDLSAAGMESYDISITASSGTDKYPAKSHVRRVAEQLGNRAYIVLQGSKSTFFSNSDQQMPFRQDRYFYYLSGCNEPDCYVSYDSAKDWLTLYLPPVNWNRFYYDGRGSTIEEALEKYDIDEAKSLLDFDPPSLLDEKCSPLGLKVFCLDNQFPNRAQTADSTSLRPAMDKCRAVKDEYEIRMIRMANKITAHAHVAVMRRLHECTNEASAEAIYTERCIASLARDQAYGPIFGSGENASTLHYVKNNQPFGNSQVLLIDAGCEWECYASDVTRTIPLNSKQPGVWPSKEAKSIFDAVLHIQEACIKMMKPGNRFSDVNLQAQRLTIQALLELGVLVGDAKEIEQAGTQRAFLPHGLGHHVGLEVHDVPPPSEASNVADAPCVFHGARHPVAGNLINFSNHIRAQDAPMEPGNVITVEPGIYFNDFVLNRYFLKDPKHSKHINADVLQRFMPVGGVRIEDDILITKNEHENLTITPKRMERVLADGDL